MRKSLTEPQLSAFTGSRFGWAFVAALSVSCACVAVSADVEVPEARAAAFVGQGESQTISLIRELSEWRSRALEAEALLSRSGIRSGVESTRASLVSPAKVLGSLESERLVILSLGRSGGALQGAMLSVGDGVIVKVVESRDSVAAALVDRSYKGKLANLEGLPVQLAVR